SRTLRRCTVGEKTRHGNTHEGVQGIPKQIESGDLVGEKLDGKKYAGSGDHPPTCYQMKAGWQIEQAGVGKESDGGYRCTYIEPRSEAHRRDETDEFGAAKLHACQISALSLLANLPKVNRLIRQRQR